MKALFINDHPFIKDIVTNTLYTSGSLNSDLWYRYLKHFDFLTVIGRSEIRNDTSKYQLAERKNVTFKLLKVKGGRDYFIKSRYIKENLQQEILTHDIIIIRLPSMFGIFAANFCIKNQIPYIVEVVGCAWDSNWNYGGLAPRLIAPYSFISMKKAVKNAVAAIYVTERFLQERYPINSNLKINASNVTVSNIDCQVIKERIFAIENSKKYYHVGVIGNLSVKYKGYDVLLKAIECLPENKRKLLRVFFVGGGDQTYLKKIIHKYNLNKQSKIIGKLKAGKEIYEFLDSLDIYIHPSKQEGLPRVVIEAMSRGCPVLASSVAGIPELIDEKYLHNVGNYKKLSKDLIKIIDDKKELKKMATNNFENSKKYKFNVIETRRSSFFQQIKGMLYE